MEYSVTRSAPSLQSPTNHLSAESVHNYGDNNHSSDAAALSPAQYGVYDEKQHFQYQNQAPSLNQLLQNNQYGPYSSLRPTNYHGNYWNVPRSQNDATRMYYTQDAFAPHGNDSMYPKLEKMKSGDNGGAPSEADPNYIQDTRQYQNDDPDKPRSVLQDWKMNSTKCDEPSSKDSTNKTDADKKGDKSNSIEMPDNLSTKPECHVNTDYNSNTPCSEMSDKNDLLYHNPNYSLDNKLSQSQLKHASQGVYENANYGQMMMHHNANYYAQMRYPGAQNNTHNYAPSGNSPMMPNRPPIVNYPPYMQSPNPVPGYGYPQMSMHQARAQYNAQSQYGPRGCQSPFSGHQDGYMNGSVQPVYSGSVKDSSDRKDDNNSLTAVKQEASDSGSTSNKSATARSSSKSKNAIKSESHPTTPVSNTIPSPSQTSMSSIIDENDDSVSSLGPNDANIMHHPGSQFNQHQAAPNMTQSAPMMYPQPYPMNNQLPHQIIGGYQGHIGPQTRPFAPNQNNMAGRAYHHQNESQINSGCFQKLLELGTEPERGPWVERYLKFMQENNTPLGAVPTVVKQPLDLFRLYHAVRDRGGLLNVVKTKRWKEICHIVNVNASASGAYTLRRNYIKCLLDFECRFDRNGVDPGPILQEIQSLSDKKKKSTSRTTGSSSSSTISSGQASQQNPEFSGNPSTPRPSLPPPDFNSPHSFPGHNPYNTALHNGALMHRNPMHYQTQRSPYPGPFNGPRPMGAFNAPPSPMHQQVRYDAAITPNWNKPPPMSPQQWASPSSSANSNSTHSMQMPMLPAPPLNSLSNPSQQAQQINSLQEHTRRMEWKSNYGGMPPPPPPPPNGQALTRGMLPTNITNPSQMALGTHPQCNYPSPTHGQRQVTPQLSSGPMPQNRHMSQTATSNQPDATGFLNKPPVGPVSASPVANSMHNMSSNSCHNRSQMDNSRPTQSYPSQYTYSKSSSSLLKRYDHLFPPNCVEVTQPDYSKKRKYSSKDIKAFNATTVTMALKCGMVAEVSWALNYMNIWSRDDSFFDKLSLKNLMPMFQALLDVWRNSLGAVFGYEMFIRNLELPASLEEKMTTTELGDILTKMEVVLKTESTDETSGEDDRRVRTIKEAVVGMLDCGKYQSGKNGLLVKLDVGCKLDSVINDRGDLTEFLAGMLSVDDDDDDGRVDDRDCPRLSDLWQVGGADSTSHILPPLSVQQRKARNHSTVASDTDNCGPPEIKRSRGSSPLTCARASSPNPPTLSHETTTESGHRCQSEVAHDGDSLFFETEEAEEENVLRCLCVSTVIRNLSFVAGNDRVMGSSRSLLVMLGRLLLAGHGRRSWWVEDLREHVLVTLVNIASHLELDTHPEGIVQPIVAGLLHWLTCQTAEAEDSLPSHRVLGCRRLALECVMRLCVHERNIDFIVCASAAGDSTVRDLFDFLAASFCHPEVQVVKEMSLAVMHYLSTGGGEDGLGCLYLASAEPSVIGGLVSFIEVTESQIRHVVDNMGMEALQARPELMGTSLEFLRHSGALLARIAACEANRHRFSRDLEMRMLNLVISTVLDQTVAQSISGVLCLLSNQDHSHAIVDRPQNKFRSFLTFDDLSFCEKDAEADRVLTDP